MCKNDYYKVGKHCFVMELYLHTHPGKNPPANAEYFPLTFSNMARCSSLISGSGPDMFLVCLYFDYGVS